jgi:hypothetical protein
LVPQMSEGLARPGDHVISLGQVPVLFHTLKKTRLLETRNSPSFAAKIVGKPLFLYVYSQGHPVSRNQSSQSSKQEGTFGVYTRSCSEPRAAYCPGQTTGRFPAYCVAPTFFVGKGLGRKQIFSPPHHLEINSTVPLFWVLSKNMVHHV